MRASSVALALALGLVALGAPAAARAQSVFDLPGIGAASLEAEDTGYEYTSVLRDAWDLRYRGSDDALSVLFGFTTMFEGDAAKAHAGVLAALMEERGDEAFAKALGREREEIRHAVLDAIAGPSAATWKRFPRTARLGFPSPIPAGQR